MGINHKTDPMSRLLWGTILLGIWQFISVSEIFEPTLFPSIPTIFSALKVSLVRGSLLRESIFSLKLIGLGLIIGVAVAALLVILGQFSKDLFNLIETFASIAHPLPGIALLPLIILWIGTGSNAILFIIVHSVLWPLYINIKTGVYTIPKIYLEISKNMDFNIFDEIIHVIIPASLPHIISGIKIGWARAWRALISAEMIFGAAGGKGGLGWYIFQKRVFMDTPGLFAGLFIIIVIGIIVEDYLLNKIEKITIKKWGTAS